MTWSKRRRSEITGAAILRWLEIETGLDLVAVRDIVKRTSGREPYNERVLYHLAKHGVEMWRLKHRILTPHTRRMIAMGVTRINRGKVALVVEKGRIVNVLPRAPAGSLVRRPRSRYVPPISGNDDEADASFELVRGS